MHTDATITAGARAHEPYLLVNGTQARESIESYRARGGYDALRELVRTRAREAVIATLSEAGLRGKGGANFPTGRKWEMVYGAAEGQRCVVCNGGEHEPGSLKDRALLEYYPHAVLEGALIAAFAIGADSVYVYMTSDQVAALASMNRAIEEAKTQGLLALMQDAAGFRCDVICFAAPSTYVAGEETAALNAIEGREAKPRVKPPYPPVEGLFGRPTLVNNVETLATVPAILGRGAGWYKDLGRGGGSGHALITLSSGVNRPGVYEVPLATTLRELIDIYGGGTPGGRAVKAVLPGGPSLPFMNGADLDVTIDPDSLKALGTGLGCGAVRLWLDGECMVEATLEVAEFFAREQCGLCPPCRMETNNFVFALKQIQSGKGGPPTFLQIEKAAAFAKGKGRCSLIHMAAAPVLSAVRLFRADFEHHLAHGRCPTVG